MPESGKFASFFAFQKLLTSSSNAFHAKRIGFATVSRTTSDKSGVETSTRGDAPGA